MVDAFAEMGINAQLSNPTADDGVDLMLDINGVHLAVEVKRRSLVDAAAAEQILRGPAVPGRVLMVVGDRVTERARQVLTVRGVGYLDLRGRLALRADGVVIDTVVKAFATRPVRADASRGKVGLEVACAILMKPERGAAVRELARQLGRSASTVSGVLASLRGDGLLDDENMVTDSRLFWRVAESWASPRTYLSQLPLPGDTPVVQALRLGMEDAAAAGWALSDSAAAAVYGAPVAFRSGQALDFYVSDQAVQRRATSLLGAPATPSQAQATVRIAPVPAVVQNRIDIGTNTLGWPLAHPLFVALDLASDPGRGREILDAWTPDDRWSRVW